MTYWIALETGRYASSVGRGDTQQTMVSSASAFPRQHFTAMLHSVPFVLREVKVRCR